ncbi:tetratricopeptide repeat protein [Devosia sp.]|uniref:tetratricopeptide repeat protein n=1 Tax=Devosia sp. TaxID=1871048 RepID=UPI003A8E99A6
MAVEEPSPEVIQRALNELLAWPGLARSPQLAKFLKYIVGEKLRGEEAGIKAYSIAVDVFGRPHDFDPQVDPIVRVQARRLRAALDDYYATQGADSAIRFYLPVGRYIPEWHVPDPSERDQAPVEVEGEDDDTALDAAAVPAEVEADRSALSLSARRGDLLLMTVVALLALALVVVLSQILQPRSNRLESPSVPSVAISEFTTVAAVPETRVAGLAVELVTDLELFQFIRPVYRLRQGQGPSRPRSDFELTGIVRSGSGGLQITASLRKTGGESVVWSKTVAVAAPVERVDIDSASRQFADDLGSIFGPLHADMVSWLAETPDISGSESQYSCSVLGALYRASGGRDDFVRARACAEALQRRVPGSSTAEEVLGVLLVAQATRMRDPEEPSTDLLNEAERLLRDALDSQPTSSDAWRDFATLREAQGRVTEAEEAYASALQLNPANIDAMAGLGRMLSLQGRSPRGAQLATNALMRHMAPPYWYHEAVALNALRDGLDAEAMGHAERLARGDAEMGSVIAVVAASRLRNSDVLNRYIAQLVEVTRFRRYGILPVLRSRIPDETLVAALTLGLTSAGLKMSTLNGPY